MNIEQLAIAIKRNFGQVFVVELKLRFHRQEKGCQH